MLTIEPEPQDSNEFAPFMGDEIAMKVVAEVSDEHCQVVSGLDSCVKSSLFSIWALFLRFIAIPTWSFLARIRRVIPPILLCMDAC